MKQPLAQTLERTGESVSRMPSWELPPANIREERDAYLLELEMPGVSKTGIEVTVENNGEVVYRESSRGDYRRSFEIDSSIDTAKIQAKMEQGILMLTLPKAESIKPRKITVAD